MASMWKRAMVYLGLADDEEYADYSEYEEHHEPRGNPGGQGHANYAPAPSSYSSYGPPDTGGTVRMLGPREDNTYKSPPPEPPYPQSSAVRTIPPPPPSQHLHVVTPSDFTSGAKEIGDRFKVPAPVIINLSSADREVARRLLDFASGLTYGLSGRIERVGTEIGRAHV